MTADQSTKPSRFPTWTFDSPCTRMEWSEVSSVNLSFVTTADATLARGDATEEADLLICGVTILPPADSAAGTDVAKDNSTVEVLLEGPVKILDQELQGALTAVAQECKLKAGATTPTLRMVASNDSSISKNHLRRIVGLGIEQSNTASGAAAALGKTIASACIAESKVTVCKVFLPETAQLLVGGATIPIYDFATAFYQTLHADNRYRTGNNVKIPAADLKTVTIVVMTGDSSSTTAESIAAAVERGRQMAAGIILTRDIVNAPHNVLNSLSLAETAQRIAAESGGFLTCQILDKHACEERGMGAYLAVARGSETPPQFIHLTYKGAGEIKKKVGIVGKGLLFDTGGYSIKTTMMELMKFDCGGAAAVLGAARTIAKQQPAGVEAHFIVAACENMINEKAYVPSDILTASNGKTIEVLNTDAEGRLTLADALVYADEEVGCEKILELSTLTGSMMVALGKLCAGIFTNNDELAAELEQVSAVSGEKSWRMPMISEYSDHLESKIADLKNIGVRWGGSITAALFLQNFVNPKKPFAHMDIAGPVWSDKDGVATGYGAKFITEWVQRQGQ